MSYECHITLETKVPFLHEKIGKRIGWKTSKIDGDPILGKGVYFYYTKHGKCFKSLFKEMNDLSSFLKSVGNTPIRLKIEKIVYDTKTGVGINN